MLPSIADFAGEIAILEGVVKVASEGALGSAAGKTVVAPGAQLYIDASAADLDFSAETMEIAKNSVLLIRPTYSKFLISLAGELCVEKIEKVSSAKGIFKVVV